VFFAGGPRLQLSTGSTLRGGDGRQTSHWKDDLLMPEKQRQKIGIMDTTIARGERGSISENDLMALDAFGYRLKRPDFSLSRISNGQC
ncbi:MAG: hypothetical protein AB1489_40655, partial [Acidobacteriota bacterium]